MIICMFSIYYHILGLFFLSIMGLLRLLEL